MQGRVCTRMRGEEKSELRVNWQRSSGGRRDRTGSEEEDYVWEYGPALVGGRAGMHESACTQ